MSSKKKTEKPGLKKHEIVWKPAASEFRDHDPAIVHQELNRIREKHGILNPDVVLEEARDTASPLNEIVYKMSADDAARAGYRAVAAKLIRSIQIRVITPEKETVTVRAFTSVHANDPNRARAREYRDTLTELSTEEGRALILRVAMLELKAFRRKYAALSELAIVMDSIDHVVQQKSA